MWVWKRFLAGLTLLIGVAALLLSLAGAIGVWVVKGPVTASATHIFERIEAALDIADQGLDHVETSLSRAAERLDSAKEEQRKLAREPRTADVARRFLARTVQQRIAPEIGDSLEELHTVAEAAVVVNSVLEDVGSLPFLSISGLDLDQLTEMNSRLADVAPAAWELSRLLGESGQEPDSDAASTQMSRVERALSTLRGMVAEYEPQVKQVRQRTDDLKSRTLPWVTPAAVLFSLVCLWVALSQISVLCHAWSWWRRAGRNNSVPS
jgi:hypothetical protein